jgi:ketosteroid isomerase-like protein
MIVGKTTAGFDFGALRGAIERRDPDALLGFYSEDAELRVENAAVPDGLAFELKGRARIERYLRAVCEQEMRCAVVGEPIFGEGTVSFVEACEYPDGVRISVSTTLEITGGRISRRIDVVERRS